MNYVRFLYFTSDFKLKYNKKSQSDITTLNVKRRGREDAQSEVQACKLNLDRIKQNFNEPKSLEFIFGVNVHNRSADGLFIYNCHRLILMHEHTKQQTKGIQFRGIVGVVDVPRMVLQPMHNKQRFIDASEEKLLITQMATYMEYYVQELQSSKSLKLDLAFWKKFGYYDMHFNYLPNDETLPKRMRIQETTTLVQCNKCLHWRVLPYNRRMLSEVGGYPPDNWECQDNTEVDKNSCRLPEYLPDIELKRIPAPVAAPASVSSVENSRGISITSRSNNQIVGRSYLAPRQTNEIQKRTRADTSRQLSQFDSDSDISTIDDRRADPDFRHNANKKSRTISSAGKNGTVNSQNSENSVAARQRTVTAPSQSIFERNIITEDADPTLPPVKQEPSVAMDTTDFPRQIGRSDNNGIDIDNLASSSNKISMVNDHKSMIIRNYQDLLSMMYRTINERHGLSGASDETLAKFEYIPFFSRFESACGAREKRETKRKIRTRVEQVLKKKLVSILTSVVLMIGCQ